MHFKDLKQGDVFSYAFTFSGTPKAYLCLTDCQEVTDLPEAWSDRAQVVLMLETGPMIYNGDSYDLVRLI